MANVTLDAMLEKFGVVTVMDVELYPTVRWTYDEVYADDFDEDYAPGEWNAVATFESKKPAVYLDTLKITNINAEGPSKTATGGMAADVLLKYGKKFTMEMQDAMGRFDVLTNLYGAKVSKNKQILAITDRFPGEYTLVGSTFVIDQATGAKQPVKIIVPIFLGNGIFNLTQDAEGDVTVFDLNGDVLRFEKESIGEDFVEVVKNGEKSYKYAPGADNSFYFFVTEEGYEDVKANGYRKAMETEAAA